MITENKKHFNFLVVLTLVAMLIVSIFVATGISAKAEATTGKTYYVSSSSGDDANDGLSEAKPWKTFAPINNNFLILKPGERILLKRGDVWKDQRLEIMGQGTSDNWAMVGDYGDKNLLKPTISMSNGNDDICILVKDFYGTVDGLPTLSPIQYIHFNNLNLTNSRLGIYVRLYENVTPTADNYDRAKQDIGLKITNCDFDNMMSKNIIDLFDITNAAEADMSLNAAQIYGKVTDEIARQLAEPKGNLLGSADWHARGDKLTTLGGANEYIFPAAILIGGRMSILYENDENAFKNVHSAIENVTLENLKISESLSGFMSWFYLWQDRYGDRVFPSAVKNLKIENVLATGMVNGGVGMDCVNGGGIYNAETNTVTPTAEGWGSIKNLRVVAGSSKPGATFALGTTSAIMNNCTNLLFNECEFSGVLNQDNADGCGLDFEMNDRNIEVKNSVFQNNDGGAILMMDSLGGVQESSCHKNINVHDNLMYNNLQNAFGGNRRNPGLDEKFYINQYNQGNKNVTWNNNRIIMQRKNKNGTDINPIGPNSSAQGGWVFEDNKTSYTTVGNSYSAYTSFSNFTLDASGKDTIQGVDLASNIYGGMFIKYKGLTEVKGTIRGVSRGYASSEKGIAFSTQDGYVDIANLKGIDWTKPYSDIEITIDGGVNNGKGVIEWVLNKTITTRDYADKKVLVELGGTSGAVFNFALTKEMFTPSGYLTNCEIESVERLGLTSAMLTLKEPLTDLQKEKITLGQHMNISSSAFVKTYSKIMSGYGRDGVQSDKSYYFVDSLKITKMPTKIEYKVGESFDASGLEVEATMVDGTKNKVSGSKYTVELDTSKEGKSLATVKHMDKIVSFEVNVVKNGASSVGCGSCNSAATAIMSVFTMLGAALFIIKK